MRRIEWRLLLGVTLVGLAALAWLGLAGLLLWAVLPEANWASLREALGSRVGLLVVLWALALLPVSVVLRNLIDSHVRAPARLAEEARLRLDGKVQQKLAARGSRETRHLAEVINEFNDRLEALRAQMDARVAEASHQVEQEKSRLAALMSELTKSVVVCTLDGRILLYNQRARVQFRRLSQAAGLTGGAELIGLGRSIYAVLDRERVGHALETVQRHLKRQATSASAQFVTTTAAGRLLRVQMTPVRSVDADGQVLTGEMSGFVLLLENITDEMEADTAKNRLLADLTEGSRSALANIRAAIEILDEPDVMPDLRERLLGVVREEVQSLSERIVELQQSSNEALTSRWPLEDMLGSDLLEAASRRIEAELPVRAVIEDTGEPLWLKIESYSLLQGLIHLAGRLHHHCGVTGLVLRLGRHEQRAVLDLVWVPDPDHPIEADLAWENEPLRTGQESLPITLRDVLERHGGDCWVEREQDEDGKRFFFRLLLPVAAPRDEQGRDVIHQDGRPEFYDFDLFRVSARTRTLEDSRLADLAYTVFDTETTGLNPVGGDEILQIGAVRIVNGKILRQERFDQLVDPGRSIPAAGITIHGITPERVRGQPGIDEVLPAFHAYCRDTVLVAHNAAFDMRCLEVKQRQTGVVFDQPVLDTLLLSALVHENHERHNLDDIAARFGLAIEGRHTALGDALVTAEIFVRLIPLLAEKNIHTLGQALEASRNTYLARVRY